MKVPELSDTASAGLQPLHGAPDAIRSNAEVAGLRYLTVDLAHVGSKAQLLAALSAGLRLPAYFGGNWDALADCLEDEDWIGPRGTVIVLANVSAYRIAHAADWTTFEDILREASDYWRERHKPLWVFTG